MTTMTELDKIRQVIKNRPFDVLNVLCHPFKYPKTFKLIWDAYSPLYQYIQSIPASKLSYDGRKVTEVNKERLFECCLIFCSIYRHERGFLTAIAKGTAPLIKSFTYVEDALEKATLLLDPVYTRTSNTKDDINKWELTNLDDYEELAKHRKAINSSLHLCYSGTCAAQGMPYTADGLSTYRMQLFNMLNQLRMASTYLKENQGSKANPTNVQQASAVLNKLFCHLLWSYSSITGWEEPRRGADPCYKDFMLTVIKKAELSAPFLHPMKLTQPREFVEYACSNYRKASIPDPNPTTYVSHLNHRTLTRLFANPLSKNSFLLPDEGDGALDFLDDMQDNYSGHIQY